MNRIAEQLDEKLRSLDSSRAKYLEKLVREAFERVEQDVVCDRASDWPSGYFAQTAGALVGEDFQRPPQGELPSRDQW